MNFCDAHWTALRQRIEDRGLTHLVAKDGETALRQMEQQVTEGLETKETFDPLMSAHWAIATNVMRTIDRAGGSPLYLMVNGPEDPVKTPGYEGRTWPRCPLCYMNLAHEVSCRHEGCALDRTAGYDWMLDRAADDSLEKARTFGLVGPPS